MLDEGFPVPAGKFFNERGHNVLRVADRKELRSSTDLQLLKIAKKEGRIFVSVDKDIFTNDNLRGEISRGPGAVLVESADPAEKQMRQILSRLLGVLSARKISGKICRASISRVVFEKALPS
jgi:predicted nuclease of predicted toxin-antitoxin system